MTASTSPFVTKPIKCPACNKPFEQRFFRQRMFVGSEKDSDQHVTKYAWLSETVEPVHPPYYFLFYCPSCQYTDTTEDFTNPSANQHGAFVVRSFRRIGDKERALFQHIGRRVRYDAIDFESALYLHFLAVLTQMLPPKDEQDAYKIGRLILRIAWLYREQAPDSEGRAKIASVDEIMNGMGPFESALSKAQDEWAVAAHHTSRRVEELKDQVPEEQNPYLAAQKSVEDAIGSLFGAIHGFKEVCKRDLAGKLLEAGADGQAGAEPQGLFVAKLKALCPVLPADEPEAIRTTLRFFEQAVSVDPRFDSPQAHYTLISLMADLYVRLDDFDSAFGMVRGMYKAATDGRIKYQREMTQNANLDAMAKRRLSAQIQRCNASLAQAAELRHKLLDLLIEREMPKIDPVIKASAGKSAEEVAKALEEAGILPGLITRLQEKKLIPAPKSKKK